MENPKSLTCQFNKFRLYVINFLTPQKINVAKVLIVKVIGTILGFVLNIMLSRLMGSAGIGVYFLALTVINIGSTIGRFGVDLGILRFASIAHDQNNLPILAALYRRGVILIVLGGLLITLIAWFVTPYLPLGGEKAIELQNIVHIMLFSLIPLSLIWLIGQLFKAIRAPVMATFVQTTIIPISLILGIALIVFWKEELEVEDAASIYVVTSLIAILIAAFSWNSYRPGLWRMKGEFDTLLLIRTSLPLLWLAIMNMAMNWADILVLGIWEDPSAIGVYGIAFRIAALLTFMLMAVNSVVAPQFASMHANGNHDALERLAQRSATLMLLVISPVALFIMAFPEFVLGFFGPEFSDGAGVLRILTLGQFVNAVIGPVGILLMMSGNERIIRNNVIFAITINLIGNIILIPYIGALGAAISTALALVIQNLLLYWKARKILRINMLFFLP